MQTITCTKTIPVVGSYDTLVAGGGCAGWIAAVSAARAGQRVALVDRYGFLGGTATAGYVVPISGFFFRGKQVVRGIAWEFVERLMARGGALPEMPKGHISYNPELYKVVAEEMLAEAGVEFYSNSVVSGIETAPTPTGQRLTHVILESKNGSEAIAARTFIDATGDGDLFARAGVPMLAQGDTPRQPLSLCFVLAGVDVSTPLLGDCIHHNGIGGKASCNAEIRAVLLADYAAGRAPQFCGPWFNTLLGAADCVAVNITRGDADATDRADVTRIERQLRADMFTLVARLREAFPAFARCEIVASAINAGVRETRHIRGVETVTLDDFRTGRSFACPVAQAAHPMDIHDPASAGQILIPLERDAYIPHTALVAPECDNLIAAGRCISAEAGPYASLRVQATLMSIGEGAGLMAALAGSTDAPVWALDAAALKTMIDARGFVG